MTDDDPADADHGRATGVDDDPADADHGRATGTDDDSTGTDHGRPAGVDGPILELDGVGHQYADERALRDVSLSVDAGELVAVVGPSGCGKTTLVQAIAGHLRPTAGTIRLRGEAVTGRPPEARNVGVVFQESTLFPHMTVAENVAYGLRAPGVDARDRANRVSECLDLVDLGGQADARPGALSGGQKRRAELARALAPRPDLLVLDEPLSALDPALRDRLGSEIARLHRETGVTTLVVTHDQERAMSLADRLVLLEDGSVAGIGSPRRLYESPPSPFVAAFLGRSTTLSAVAVDSATLSVGGVECPAPADCDVDSGQRVRCHLRPTSIDLVPLGDATERALGGTVDRVSDLGRRYDVAIDLDAGDELLAELTGAPPTEGDRVAAAFDPDDVTVFPDADADAFQSSTPPRR